MTSTAPDWTRAQQAIMALAIDPAGLKGVVIRARAGPVRTELETTFSALQPPLRRIHPVLSDAALFGGLDLAASLDKGRAVRTAGLVASPAVLILPMAERTPPGLASRLAQVMDANQGHVMILLDEGADLEEAAPSSLTDRLAFGIDLGAVAPRQAMSAVPPPANLDRARRAMSGVRSHPSSTELLVDLAARFGIGSLRAPHFALRAARAFAALDGRQVVGDADIRLAAELVYAPRATHVPDISDPRIKHSPEPQGSATASHDTPPAGPSGDMLIEAVKACLPADLLSSIASGRSDRRLAQGSGAGTSRRGYRRGRPLPSRHGRPDGSARIDVIATLRAAAPWQRLRQVDRTDPPKPIIRPQDIRLCRYQDRSDRLLIFVVDASGSAAIARLAEAKGAIELLLGQAYSRRDQVALVSFRGRAAQFMLPPTRSLVQAKRRIAALPGGGGTPLASGLHETIEIVERALRQGLSPALVLLTDGRANVALDGSHDRQKATHDAEGLARRIAANRLPALLIDISPRREPRAMALAQSLAATYVPLPNADAKRISRAVTAALAG